MGFWSALRPGLGTAELTAAAALVPSEPPVLGPTALASPFAAPNHLASVVWADLLGLDFRPVTRAEAMRVPAVARARHIITGTIGRIPLRAYRGDTRLSGPDEPSWIGQADSALSTFHRMLWTVDDLLFYGWSCWRRTANGVDGFPLRMERIPFGQWSLEADTGRVLIYKPDQVRGGYTLQPANTAEVVLIPGATEGLLVDGAAAVRHADQLQRTAHNAARFPTAYLGLKQTTGTPLKRHSEDPAEVTIDTILADWKNARLNPDGGGVAWLGGVEVVELGSFADHLVTEGRNAAAVDIARHANIPADLIDASVPESSLHYSTSRDNDRRTIDYGLGPMMTAISASLSLDKVTPRGQRVAFDLEEWLAGALPQPGQLPTGAPGVTSTGTNPVTEETPQ